MTSKPQVKVIAPRSLEELMRELGGAQESAEELEKLRAQLLGRPEWLSRNPADIQRLRTEIQRFNERAIDSQRRLVYGTWAMHQLTERMLSRNLT